MILLQEELSRVAVGDPRHFRKLTLFPLLRSDPEQPAPDYLTADDAVARGVARVTELNGGGSVPELRFENDSDLPVLLLDGEELVGAKQNRVLNLTILAPPKAAILIPVSCVEAGRWHLDAEDFRPAPHVMYSTLRAERLCQVTASMRSSGNRRSDQGAVWEEIAAKTRRMDAPSPTGAMSAVYERHAASVEEFVRALRIAGRHCGLLFAIGGRPLGLDIFDHPATMERLSDKLIRSYALDALDSAGPDRPADGPAASEFIERLRSATGLTQPAAGMGKDLRVTGAGISGAALWANGRYIHVCAFSTRGRSDRSFLARMSRPSRRRRP